ncbi:unnamed protein product [Agarophyton chilense]
MPSSIVSLRIQDLFCISCVNTVTKALEAVPSVHGVDLSLQTGIATLSYDGDPQLLLQAVEGAGKKAQLIAQTSPRTYPRYLTLHIDGMTCINCVKKVSAAISALPSTSDVHVDLESATASLLLCGEVEQVMAAVRETGKQASLGAETEQYLAVTLNIEGMTCMGCVRTVSDALSAVNGTEDVNVSLENGLATLRYASNPDHLIVAVSNAGKSATLVSSKHVQGSPSQNTANTNSTSVMQHHFSSKPSSIQIISEQNDAAQVRHASRDDERSDAAKTTTHLRVSGMTCSSCVGVVEGVLSNLEGVSSARVNLLAGRATVEHDSSISSPQMLADTLSSSGYTCSVLDTVHGKQSKHSRNASVQFRIVFQTSKHSYNASKALRFQESVQEVELDDITASITLAPGFHKAAVLRLLEHDGTFGKMVVRQAAKPESESLRSAYHFSPTDVISEEARMWKTRFLWSFAFFLPILTISLLHSHTSLVSKSFMERAHFVLATPVQFGCGSGFYRASYYAIRKGRATMDVLVAMSTTIVYVSSFFVMVFGAPQVGTLTMGKPEVAAVFVGERGSATTEQASVILSDIVYLVESESHHPLASAITRYIRNSQGDMAVHVQSHKAYKLSEIEEIPGQGMKAMINKGEYSVRIGSRQFAFDGLEEKQLLTEGELRSMQRMEEQEGLTVVVAVVNDKLTFVFGLEDLVRPEARDVVTAIEKMGITTSIVTGDSEETARAVALRSGIPLGAVHARAMPWTKVAAVEEKQPTCFVGDGINDAPALAAASVGIAIGAGAPVAAESAAVVLVRSDLRGVVNALDLSRQAFRRVRLNFCWAIGYNIIGIPLAAGALYPIFRIRVPPFVASGAMALSSTCVVLSSLALRWYKAPIIGDEIGGRGTDMMDVSRQAFVIEDESNSLDEEYSVEDSLLAGN